MSIDLYSYQACLGTLVIDWINRTVTFAGMDGDGGSNDDEMTIDQVKATLAEHADKFGIEAKALIFWPENEQLSVHDAASFAEELAHDREIKNEDMAGSDDTEEGPDDDVIRQLAKDQYASGEIDIDDDAVVSTGDAGAYVAAWVFVDKGDIPGWDQDDDEEDPGAQATSLDATTL